MIGHCGSLLPRRFDTSELRCQRRRGGSGAPLEQSTAERPHTHWGLGWGCWGSIHRFIVHSESVVRLPRPNLSHFLPHTYRLRSLRRMKRPWSPDSTRAEDAGLRRKRFFWADALHSQFIGALFDVGLNNATPVAVQDIMLPPTPAAAQPDQIQQRIRQLVFFRKWCSVERNNHARSPNEAPGIAVSNEAEEDTTPASFRDLLALREDRRARLHAARISLQRQAAAIGLSVTRLASLQDELGQSLETQRRLLVGLAGEIGGPRAAGTAALSLQASTEPMAFPGDPQRMAHHPSSSRAVAGRPKNESHAYAHRGAAAKEAVVLAVEHAPEVNSANNGYPARAAMEREMLEHMNIHRTMANHMNLQLAQFGASAEGPVESAAKEGALVGAVPGTVPGVIPVAQLEADVMDGEVHAEVHAEGEDWADLDDVLEDQLFGFLRD